MPKISPRIAEHVESWLATTFDTKTGGAEYCLESFQALYRGTLARELKGVFSAGELCLICDITNSLHLTPGLAGQQIQADVEDGIALDGLDQKWEIDGPAMVAKLRGLSLFQVACLEIWAKAFWVTHSQTLGGADLDKWVAVLARGLDSTPMSPVEGQKYIDTETGHTKIYTDGAWVDSDGDSLTTPH